MKDKIVVKKYIKPQMEIVVFDAEDIITASNPETIIPEVPEPTAVDEYYYAPSSDAAE